MLLEICKFSKCLVFFDEINKSNHSYDDDTSCHYYTSYTATATAINYHNNDHDNHQSNYPDYILANKSNI